MKTRIPLLLVGAAACACLTFAAMHTDYDRKADFSRYRTYSWLGVKAGDSLSQHRVIDAVDSALSARGLTKVASGGDLAVSAFGRATEHETLETFYSSFPSWNWRATWWGLPGTATPEVIPEHAGNLTLDLFDGHTRELVWRGRATDALPSKTDKKEKKLERAVHDLLDKFPPKSGG